VLIAHLGSPYHIGRPFLTSLIQTAHGFLMENPISAGSARLESAKSTRGLLDADPISENIGADK
jgi:hypothetical protein